MKYKIDGKRYAALCMALAAALMIAQPCYADESGQPAVQVAANGASGVSEAVQNAVDFLMSMGLASGKADGNYHPEDSITREEFAKLLVGVLGLENEAALSKGEQKFSDVPKDRWSYPYVSIAVGMDMAKGFEDGTFRPQAQVTKAQAAAMLVRCFGYNDSYVQGEWPLNYVSKAAELGILAGMDGDYSVLLSRGDAALMVKNALHGKYIFGDDEGSMLMSKKRDIYLVKGARLVKVIRDSGIESMEFELTKDSELEGETAKIGEKYTFTNPASVFVQPGETVDLYVDKDERILYVPRISNSADGSTIQAGGMKAIANSYSQKPYGMIKLEGEDKYVRVDTDSSIMLDGKKVNKDEYDSILTNDAYGSFVVKNGKLDYANLVSWDSSDFVVKTFDAGSMTLVCVDTEGGVDEKLTLKSSKTAYEAYIVSGGGVQKADLSVLQSGDVIRIGKENRATNAKPVYIFRDKVEGAFERVSGGTNGKSITFRLSGRTDVFEFADAFAYSYNAGKRIRSGSSAKAYIASNLKDFYNESVKIYRNYAGEIVYVEGNFTSRSDQYGILMQFGDAVRGEIKLFTQTGSKSVYAFEDSDEYENLKANVSIGTIIKYSQTKSGAIKNLSEDFERNIINADEISVIGAGDDFTADSVEIDGRTYKVDSDTVFFDYSQHNPDSAQKLTWEKFKGREVVSDVEVISDFDGDYLLMMAVWNNLEGIKEETNVGYVVDNFSLGDSKYVEVYEYDNEGLKRYKLEDDYEDLMLQGRLITYQITTSDNIKVVEDDELKFVSGEVTASGSDITIDGTKYRLEDGAIGFENGKSVGAKGIDKNELVAAYIKSGKIVAVEDISSQADSQVASGTLVSVDPDSSENFVIEVDGKELAFVRTDNMDFVFKDGYMEIDDESTDPVELFGRLVKSGKNIKFSYNKYTDEIYSIWVDDSQK